MASTEVASVEVAPGISITSDMTPTERYNAVARTMGAPTVRTPQAAPQFHTDATVRTVTNRERDVISAAKASPPVRAPGKVPFADPNKQAEHDARIARFDAEQRAAGKQLPTAAEEQKLRADSVKWLENWANSHDDVWIKKSERTLRDWAKKIEAGTHLVRWNADKTGVDIYERNAPAAPARSTDDTVAVVKAADIAAKASNAAGEAPGEAITGPLLHGYTLPTGRLYHVADTVAHLKMAHAGNLSQSQVDAIIKAGL